MLSLRMEGRCSIEATSTIMKRFGINLPSTGSISQYLKQFGSFVPNTLATENDEFQMVVFLSDEIFSKNIRHASNLLYNLLNKKPRACKDR